MDQYRHPIAGRHGGRHGGFHCAGCGVLLEDGQADEHGDPSLPADELCDACQHESDGAAG